MIKCEHSENKKFNRNVHNQLRKKYFEMLDENFSN